MNKQALHNRIVDVLQAGLELYMKAATTARFEATHEQSKAENKYDTRGLEASYLARGQSRQAAETQQSIEAIRAMPPKDFSGGQPVDLGAYLEIVQRNEVSRYFLAPRGGGTEVEFDGNEIVVITPQSPLGRQILGRKEGEVLKLDIGGRTASHTLRRVL